MGIKPAGPVPYSSDRAVPFRYNPVAVQDGIEVPLPSTSVTTIADVSGLTRSGRVFSAPPKATVSESVERPVGTAVNVQNSALDVAKPSSSVQKTHVSSVGPSGIVDEESDEMLRLIRKSEYNIVDQLLHTPSKISILSLLLNSESHRESLQKVLDLAYVDHDVTLEQFDSIVANITACNTLSFCDADLPEEGRDHNMALHISMNCKSDAMSNVLVDTGSSLNVLPKSTLSRLSYQGPPMRQSGVVVKAFDGSRKTVIGEVDLPIKIGPSDFQVTFQVMDIHPSYSCLLGRPWIHEAGAVTSTLHQKLKFVKNKKLVVVEGEKALLVSHLSSFSYIDAEDEVGTQFQALSIDEPIEKKSPSFTSYRDAKLAIDVQGLFTSGGFIHADQPAEEEAAAIIEEEDAEDLNNFVIPGGVCHNWVAVDVPTVIHRSELILKPIEHNDPTPSPNFEFPVFEAEEDDIEEIPDEITRLLEHSRGWHDFQQIFVGVVPQTELLLGLFPSTVASRVLLKTSFSPAAVFFPACGVTSRVVIDIPSESRAELLSLFPVRLPAELSVSSAHLLCIFSPSGVVRCRIYLFDLSSLSGFVPQRVADIFPSRVAYAVRFYLDDIILPQWVIPQRSYLDLLLQQFVLVQCTLCFSVDTEIPCRYFGTSLVPLQIRLGGRFARCDFLYPDWVVS
ncbi:hypothetical protein KIW84_030712 [Lathyrus oleraceus]|uniref:Uncharacterized protein n=1 Tax=Pisum sativum TaxID=3888 RepID=A0A9D5AZU9_PEA|nr:hypothetical protein KIW84_030712 [Pisum sativum]